MLKYLRDNLLWSLVDSLLAFPHLLLGWNVLGLMFNYFFGWLCSVPVSCESMQCVQCLWTYIIFLLSRFPECANHLNSHHCSMAPPRDSQVSKLCGLVSLSGMFNLKSKEEWVWRWSEEICPSFRFSASYWKREEDSDIVNYNRSLQITIPKLTSLPCWYHTYALTSRCFQ